MEQKRLTALTLAVCAFIMLASIFVSPPGAKRGSVHAQTGGTRWSATTGDLSLSVSATIATVQNLAVSQAGNIYVDQIQVYCSVACSATQYANGTAATATAGTVNAILPTQLTASLPLTFWTGSNVGAGIEQGGVTHVPAGSTVVLCLSPSCGAPAQVTLGPGGGTASNYSLSIGAITGTANVTFFGRTP